MIEAGAGGDHFYVTLPSNSSEAFYGRQHPSNYITKLDAAINLNPEHWEVGLAEIIFPKTWANVAGAILKIITPQALTIVIPFSAKRYVSSEHLVREVQLAITRGLPHEHAGKIKAGYDYISKRIRFDIERGYKLILTETLALPLGVSNENGIPYKEANGEKGFTLPRHPDSMEGHHTVYVDRQIPVIYVYCNLVERQRVGDSYVPLLRTLNVPETQEGDLVVRNFTNVHYSDLQRGVFETVEIHIVDGTGKNIPFELGHTIVKLHFKRKHR